MRVAHLWLIAGSLLSAGCSAIIATSGLDLDPLHNRDDVRRQFGSPSETGSESSHEYDEYRTRRKIADRMTANGMAFVMTFGLSEFVGFPYELYRLGRSTVHGQTVRFSYDEFGNVHDVHIDGERPWWLPSPPSPYTQIGEGDEAEPEDEAATREQSIHDELAKVSSSGTRTRPSMSALPGYAGLDWPLA